MSARKIERGYRSYEYLERGVDYRAFTLAKEIGRVPAAQLSTGRINEGVTFSEVAHVKGMENPGEATRNGIRWLVKHGYSDDDVRKVSGANALRVLRDTWVR